MDKEQENIMYKEWKNRISENKNMREAWKFLISISEKKRKRLIALLKKEDPSLTKEQLSSKIKEKREEIAKNIFNVIVNRPCNFEWERRTEWNASIKRYISKIRILDSKSRYTLKKIREYKGVSSIRGESIDDCLIPIAKEIKILQEAMNTSYRISGVNKGSTGDGSGGSYGARRQEYNNY